jgi:TRAP-type C4-dicarboxylate transport system permease small subunit
MMRRAINALSWGAGLTAGALLMGLIFLTGTDVLWRNFHGRSIPGAYEYSEVLLVALVFLSLAWTQKVDAHVSIDLATRAMPERLGRLVQALGIAAALAILVWMTVASVHSALESWVSGEYRIGLAEVPVWPARLAVAFGMFMLVLQLTLRLVDLARSRANGS